MKQFVLFIAAAALAPSCVTVAESWPSSSDREQEERIVKQAYQLLQSVGLENLCNPERRNNNHLSMYFPVCDNATKIHPKEQLRNNHHRGMADDEDGKDSPWNFNTRDILFSTICVLISGMASGLTIGMLSLDPLVLLIKSRVGNAEEAAQAASLLPIIKQRHLLLVTLLLANTASSEALPIFLSNVAPAVFVVILSVVLILVFGEILPSAIFSGKNQIALASMLARFVKILMWLVYPLAYPISLLLDFILREEPESGAMYNRNELAALIRIQYEERTAAKQRRMQTLQEGKSRRPSIQDSSSVDAQQQQSFLTSPVNIDRRKHVRRASSIHFDEVTVAEGALNMKTKFAKDLYLSYRKVFAISLDTILNEKNIINIFSSAYSRIPVYEGNCKTRIKGILMTRQLIVVNSNDNVPLSTLPLHIPQCVSPDSNMIELINLFQTGGAKPRRVGHMALVCARPDVGNSALEQGQPIPDEAGLMGIITLEDVLEALLQEQIYDEMDAAGRKLQSESAEEGIEVDSYYHLT